jgi:hypothetical protein
MQNNKAAAVTAAYVIGLIAVPAAGYIKTIVSERKKRAAIAQREKEQIEAIHLAGDAIKEMIDEGLYDKRFYQVWGDFDELVKLYQSK